MRICTSQNQVKPNQCSSNVLGFEAYEWKMTPFGEGLPQWLQSSPTKTPKTVCFGQAHLFDLHLGVTCSTGMQSEFTENYFGIVMQQKTKCCIDTHIGSQTL